MKRLTYLIITGLIQLGTMAQDSNYDYETHIKDTSLYDSSFVAYFGYLRNWGVRFSQDSIVIAGETSDPILIPTDLPLNQTLYYNSEKNDIQWMLDVKRVSFTNIEYSVCGEQAGIMHFEGTGLAILTPSFHLACEGVYETNEGEAFGMNNYFFRSGNIEDGKLLIPEKTTEMIGYSHRIEGEEVILRFLRNSE